MNEALDAPTGKKSADADLQIRIIVRLPIRTRCIAF